MKNINAKVSRNLFFFPLQREHQTLSNQAQVFKILWKATDYGDSCLDSQCLEGWGRRIAVSSWLAWTRKWDPLPQKGCRFVSEEIIPIYKWTFIARALWLRRQTLGITSNILCLNPVSMGTIVRDKQLWMHTLLHPLRSTTEQSLRQSLEECIPWERKVKCTILFGEGLGVPLIAVAGLWYCVVIQGSPEWICSYHFQHEDLAILGWNINKSPRSWEQRGFGSFLLAQTNDLSWK